MLMRSLLLASILTGVLGAQTLKNCHTLYLQPMPESLDEFVSVELLKWGAIKVVTNGDKADCIASFGRLSTRTEVQSSGSELVPTSETFSAETVHRELPEAHAFFTGDHKQAALTLIDRNSSAIVWADSKSDSFSFTAGPRTLARRLVDQMKKDYGKVNK